MKRVYYKAVIFDMDGVIFDSEVRVCECWEEVAAKYGIPNIRETIYKCIGINAEATAKIFKDTYGDAYNYEYYRSIVRAMFQERYGNGKLPTKPGIRRLLGYLKKMGVKIAVASSTRIEKVTEELNDAKLYDYFDVVVGGDMVTRSKPNPEIFLEACKRLEISPEEAFIIEDSYNGIRAASRAGSRPIMVPDIKQPNEEMEELSFGIFSSLIEVKKYLDSFYVYPHLCRCCGEEVIADEYDICPKCKWEDNRAQSEDVNMSGGANELSLSAAREAINITKNV